MASLIDASKMGSEIEQVVTQQHITKRIQPTAAKVCDWLLRANFHSTRKFFLGIVRRINNLDLLRRIISVFSSVKQKDFTYSRSQCNSSLLHEHKHFSSNRYGVSPKEIDRFILKTWNWFSTIEQTDQSSFVFFISMVINNSTILHQASNLAKTMHVQLTKELNENSVSELDTLSLASSTYTFNTDEHPNLYLLAALKTQHHNSRNALSEEIVQAEAEYFEDDLEKRSTSTLSSLSNCSSFFSQDPRNVLAINSSQALSGIKPFVDFISKLPVHLAKNIVSFLDVQSMCNASLVCKAWYHIVQQVTIESRTKQEIFEEAVMMQGVSAKGVHPSYAKKKSIAVPYFLLDQKNKKSSSSQIFLNHSSNSQGDVFSVIPGLTVNQCEMEERNVYCGPYNVLILDKQSDKHRVVHYGGGGVVASGSNDRAIRLFDINTGNEIFPSIRGHPGSITSVFVADGEKKYIFSGSYDTTIRRWHIGSSSCHQIMHGHHKSITSLDHCNDTLVSGSKDGLIKIWNIQTGKCVCMFKHAKCSPVTCVKLHEDTVVSSCDRGIIKVWDLSSRKLAKRLIGHTDAVSEVAIDQHYIVSASYDGFAMAWTKNGNINQPIKSYRHPKKVLCIALRYLRIVSGCEDGKIRVLHLHSGECLRVVRGNSKCDPILSICATANRLIVNTVSNVLLLQFEPIQWNYDLKYGETVETTARNTQLQSGFNESTSNHTNCYLRACRNLASSSTCSNIRNRPISAPVIRQGSPAVLKRPFSSYSCIASQQTKKLTAFSQRPVSGYSVGSVTSAEDSKVLSHRGLNVHNSKAMSVISGISAVILQEDAKLDERLDRRNSSAKNIGHLNQRRHCFSRPQSEKFMSRDRVHLRIGSIHHNISNSAENIHTALNGSHPDVREWYHAARIHDDL